MKNNIFIGINSGSEITEGDGLTIIGDNIKSFARSENVLFIGDRIAIGDTVLGQPCNLKEIIEGLYKSYTSPFLNNELP